jgi:hypothetical protein
MDNMMVPTLLTYLAVANGNNHTHDMLSLDMVPSQESKWETHIKPVPLTAITITAKRYASGDEKQET